MRLEKIKLSGFKSFVDPTVISLNSNLTAIVGPNGCGKSNIIDAVRWVMGESSAKHLRGGSMTDVIFNGSSGRKPVSTASVELVFDNTESKLGGEYAQYDSIAIKRQVSRDGQSVYLLNGSRCRRKDITDIFLGTGLGSRSYAIIEQGTISRMVEAKPDELRIHIEEAAGISKYKERRLETETRMKHTRENLERLDDLREEVDKQLKHLQKQSEKAEKYTELKQQERQFKLELLAMRWNNYHQIALQLETKLQTSASEHNRLFVALRDIDSHLEGKRVAYKSQQQLTDAAQGQYYQTLADVSGLEQAIRHNELSQQETANEINRLQEQAERSSSELASDIEQLENLKQDLIEAEQELVFADEHYENMQQSQYDSLAKKQAWQQQWDNFRTENAKSSEQAEILRIKSMQLENQNRQLQIRLDKLQQESTELGNNPLQANMDELAEGIEIIQLQREQLRLQLEQTHEEIGLLRQTIKHEHEQLHRQRSELQHIQGKITSLELLQQHAMGKDNKVLMHWLEHMQLSKSSRLAEFLEVDAGWEKAVESVLGSYLEAICLADMEPVIAGLPALVNESISMIEMAPSVPASIPVDLPKLQDKIRVPWDLGCLLAGIYCAEDAPSGRQLAKNLGNHESVITPDGSWFGKGWIRIIRSKDSKTGVLQREKDLRQVKLAQNEITVVIAAMEEHLDLAENRLKTLESNREVAQKQDAVLASELSAKLSQLSAQSARLEQQQRRLQQLEDEISENIQEIAENAGQIEDYAEQKVAVEMQMAQLEQKRLSLETENGQLQALHVETETITKAAQQALYALKARIESLHSSEALAIKQIDREQQQHQQALIRIEELRLKLEQTLKPLDAEKIQLSELSREKIRLEQSLKQHRLAQEQIELEITRFSEQHLHTQKALESQKEALDKLRFELQESEVRQQTVQEQLREIEADIDFVLKNLPAQADELRWKSQLDDLVGQIERLGTINLTAIEEYKSQAERLNFLNEQHADLTEALFTLEQAINKIDKESRLRFKETFDKINSGLQEKFPKLFGGGQAYLALTENPKETTGTTEKSDAEQIFLEAGVNIIARPPGKRNSSIHLLSGGEKALTAVALVFSIFELNPAPFCLLDEVDAPLDDANVGRFSAMVEEMSASVQFLYISHNKATMEIAKQLAGVTMKEPGVSRMVAVDIEEAVNLAET
ncbi:MAG: chromosome segregation protein SMC [Methylococcaceae bacterium]|jgi:chromosome segregation protein